MNFRQIGIFVSCAIIEDVKPANIVSITKAAFFIATNIYLV